MEPATWLDDFHDALNAIYSCQVRLEDLGKSMCFIGMGEMGQNLLNVAEGLEQARKQAGDAIGKELTDRVKASGELFNTVGKAALAGALTVLKSIPE